MLLKRLKILSDSLWESIQSDTNFFSPIVGLTRKLHEFDYSNKDNYGELVFLAGKIDSFFDKYRDNDKLDGVSYIEPRLLSDNNETLEEILKTVEQLMDLNEKELQTEIHSIKHTNSQTKTSNKVFIGHGRSKLWARLKIHIEDDLGLKTTYFENESRTSQSVVNILEEMLEESSYAVLILTAEDETSDKQIRARQNVIHEVGLFQGRLGFDKVILLMQDQTENFSNIAGLQYIPFSGDNIEQTFYELGRKFKKLNGG